MSIFSSGLPSLCHNAVGRSGSEEWKPYQSPQLTTSFRVRYICGKLQKRVLYCVEMLNKIYSHVIWNHCRDVEFFKQTRFNCRDFNFIQTGLSARR